MSQTINTYLTKYIQKIQQQGMTVHREMVESHTHSKWVQDVPTNTYKNTTYYNNIHMSNMLNKLVTTFINLSISLSVSVVLTVVTTFYTGQTQKSTSRCRTSIR